MANLAELGIVVKQQGVEKAANALAKLAGEAKTSSETIDKLLPILKSLSNINLTSTAVEVRQIALSIATLAKAMKDISSVSGSMSKATTSITNLATASLKLGDAAQKLSGMSRELSSLQTALGGFGMASTSVTDLRAEIGNLITNIRNAQAAANKGITVNTKVNQKEASAAISSRTGGRTTPKLDVGTRSVESMAKLARESDKAGRSVHDLGRGLASVRNTIFNITALGGLTALGTSLAKAADSMTLVEGKLKLMVGGGVEFNRVQESLLKTAKATGSGIVETTDLFTRLRRSTADTAISTNSLLKVSDGLAKAMVVGGDSVGSFNAAMFQMSQGLAANALRGQELNSVAEQAGVVFKALQKGLGLSAGELRKFAADGKLTADVVVNALEKGLKAVSEEYERMPLTIERAANSLKTDFLVAINEVNKQTGATHKLAHSIKDLGESFSSVVPLAVAFIDALPTAAIAGAAIALGKMSLATKAYLVSQQQSIVSSQQQLVVEKNLAYAKLQVANAELASAQAQRGNVAMQGAVLQLQKQQLVALNNYQAAAKAATISTIGYTKAVTGLKSALAAIGGVPALMIGAVLLIISYYDDIAAAAGNAGAAARNASRDFENALAKNDFLEAKKQVASLTDAYNELDKKSQQLNKNVNLYIKGSPKYNLALKQATEAGKEKAKAWGKMTDANLKLAEAKKRQVNEAVEPVTRQYKGESAEGRAEIDAHNKKLAEQLKEEAKKKKKAKKAAIPSISSYEKRESKGESDVETYRRNIERMRQTGEATEQLNKHEKKAIELQILLSKAKNATEKASYAKQIALEKEAGSLLRQQNSLEEYLKTKKEIEKAEKKSLQSRDNNIILNSLDTNYQKQKIAFMQMEISLQERLNDIRENENLLPDDKKKLAKLEIDRTEREKARVPSTTIEEEAHKAGDGWFAFLSADKINEAAEIERVATEEATARRMEALLADQDLYLENMQLFEDKKKAIAEEGALAIEDIEKRAIQAKLMGMETSLSSAEGLIDQFSGFLKAAGAENSALAKAAFVAQKAIAIGQAIVNTELAATQFLGDEAKQATVRAMGYASVALIAATSVAEMSGGKFAKGAAFSKGAVVSSPTTFGMSGGRTGLMGEAGAEAVMPLTRDSSGRLGVSVQNGGGGGGNSVNTSINVTVNGNADETTVDNMVGEIKKIVDYQIIQQMRAGGLLQQRR